MMQEELKQFYKDKKILVTGGAGFIGSHLCEQLTKSSQVISIDNYFTGTEQNHVEGVTYVDACVSKIDEIFERDEFDLVFHFGEYSRVEQSLGEPDLAITNIRQNFFTVINFCEQKNAKLIYSGSSTKFAEQGSDLSPYTFSKSQNTDLLTTYANWYGLRHAIIYFYNVYGGREIHTGKYATVVAKFLEMRRNGRRKLPVTSPGTQRRNFTHINDVIEGILLVGAYGNGDMYGIGADESISIIELCNLLGCEAEFMPSHQSNRLSAPVMNEKLKKLGWSAKKSLENYIADKLIGYN